MPTKTRRPKLTEAQREERRREAQELTEQAVEQLRASDGWQRWLTIRAQVGLRRYSVGNQLLIALQDPDATRVAGFRAWMKLGYCVRKGEHSHISVWARCAPSKKRMKAWRDAGADPAREPRPVYRLEPVFSSEQVDPLPPPAEPAPLDVPIAPVTGDTLGWALEPLTGLAGELGCSVEVEAMPTEVGGSYTPSTKRIALNEERSVNARVLTLCHELAHALVDVNRREDDPELSYAQEELVAESVALIACGGVSLDTEQFSVPYLACWSEHTTGETWRQIAELVDRLARRLEDTLLMEGA